MYSIVAFTWIDLYRLNDVIEMYECMKQLATISNFFAVSARFQEAIENLTALLNSFGTE